MVRKSLCRKSVHSIASVFQAIKPYIGSTRDVKADFCTDRIKLTSQRLELFYKKGVKCVNCGIEGVYFAKEKGEKDESYHLNLYGINEAGEEVLMTKDHILPRSKGGANHIDNYQTMCTICNVAKGSR